jgi:hypothetical protein
MVFEREVLRRIFGPTKERDGTWGTKTNDELNELIRHKNVILLLLFSTMACSLKAYCAILVRRSNFLHQASPRVSPRESTQRRRLELWARKVLEF